MPPRGASHEHEGRPMSGRVVLVGAGPGDPELLTLKAVRALREADVVLHDALVSPEILDFARPGARVIAVGKRGGCRSTPQRFIEQLLVREARAGNRVVRLKGGDPFVFGRGGEEMAALRAAGIPVDVVPGITAGLAAPAAAGIPVTHRAHAHGVAFVTGHAADGSDEAPDWDALVRTGLTLVVYMGMARADALRASLLAAGMPARTPVAVIANATRPGQRAVAATLATFVEDARRAALASPAIIVAGDAAAYAACAMADQPGARKAAGADVQT
jgi:uroporphyrin-III C-methyltransferase